MKTIIAFRVLVAAALMAAGMAFAGEPLFDVNAYQISTDRIVGQVRHLVTEEQANQFLEGLHPAERSNGLYYLKAAPAEEGE